MAKSCLFNMLDKGHRVTQHVFRHFQHIVQPTFAKEGRKSTGSEGLCVSEAVSDRSGNVRAAKCVKMVRTNVNRLSE